MVHPRFHQICGAWRAYGVEIRKELDDSWTWAEIDDEGNDGQFSPAFDTFEQALSDLEATFGPLSDQA